MKRIRNWLVLAVYSVVLVGVPMAHNAMTTIPAAQPALQLACYGSGSACGGCC